MGRGPNGRCDDCGTKLYLWQKSGKKKLCRFCYIDSEEERIKEIQMVKKETLK